jgi:hypothetical protein
VGKTRNVTCPHKLGVTLYSPWLEQPSLRPRLEMARIFARNLIRIVALSETPAELTLFSLSGSVLHSDENAWPETHLDLETEVADGCTAIC